MSGQPFMQLYVGDYLADTTDLTTEQHGAYLLVLMTMWRHGAKLPNDAKKLARIARVSTRRWHLVWNEIAHFFYEDGEDIRNKRLDREYQKAVSISEKRIASGAKGGAAKALKNKEPPLANATDLPKHSQKSEPERKTEPIGSDAKASLINVGEDARKVLFDEALPLLARYTGKPVKTLRPLVGKWLNRSGDDARRIALLITETISEQRAEPVAWIEGCLKQKGHKKGKFVIKADGTVHKEDEHTGEWWRCYGIEPHQVEKIAIRDHRNREAA
jgi:uncharacterized protein YdaU (DUF1376 family)